MHSLQILGTSAKASNRAQVFLVPGWEWSLKAQSIRGSLGRNGNQDRDGQGLSSPLADCHYMLPPGPPLRATGPAAGVSGSRAEVAASCRGGCRGGPKERRTAPSAALAGEAAPRGGREEARQQPVPQRPVSQCCVQGLWGGPGPHRSPRKHCPGRHSVGVQGMKERGSGAGPSIHVIWGWSRRRLLKRGPVPVHIHLPEEGQAQVLEQGSRSRPRTRWCCGRGPHGADVCNAEWLGLPAGAAAAAVVGPDLALGRGPRFSSFRD